MLKKRILIIVSILIFSVMTINNSVTVWADDDIFNEFPEIHLENETIIDENCFSEYSDNYINIYLNSNINETISNDAFVNCKINSIIVDDDEEVDMEYLQIPNENIISLQADNKAVTVSDTYADTFKYKLMSSLIRNDDYMEKISNIYCSDVASHLQISNTNDVSKIQKIIMIFDWIKAHNKYAKFYNKNENGEIVFNNERYSENDILTRGKYAQLISGYGVCSSYSELFKLYMDILNIESIIVSNNDVAIVPDGQKHSWNLVELNDGEWYYIDSTGKVTINSNNFNFTGTIIADEIEIISESNLNFNISLFDGMSDIAGGRILSDFQLMLADMDKNNFVDVFDSVLLRRKLIA